MNDRELLELAAKAAGIRKTENGLFENPCRDGDRIWWNSLEDDGDAFRLATLLPLSVYQGMDAVFARRILPEGPWSDADITHQCDRNKATRLAITRAAAEIGRGMANAEIG